MQSSTTAPTPRRLGALALGAILVTLLTTLTLAGCGPTTPDSSLPTLTLGLTYVPNVQFAPFYVAEELGYYKTAGLNVILRHHNVGEDEFAAFAAGRENAIFAGGDEVLQARSKGLSLVYVASVFARYPVALIVPANSSITSIADLRGHTIGVPGLYGATYIGLLALLRKAGLSQSDVHIQSIGYTQVSALLTHKVDAVMGYLNNETIQFQQAKFAVRTFAASAAQPLISNGLAAPPSLLSKHPAEVKALIAATLRGVEYTIAHPQEAYTICKKYVTALNDPSQTATQFAVLQATIALFKTSAGARMGYTSQADWQSMYTFLQSIGQLSGTVDITQAYSNAYLP
ncbi:MAG TPA: ABC transporter substrate-binding protein [Ktedonobacterales bacterium]|nr:ABC transporter substrate-binding protein [Ktedonobacterales bacterium]